MAFGTGTPCIPPVNIATRRKRARGAFERGGRQVQRSFGPLSSWKQEMFRVLCRASTLDTRKDEPRAVHPSGTWLTATLSRNPRSAGHKRDSPTGAAKSRGAASPDAHSSSARVEASIYPSISFDWSAYASAPLDRWETTDSTPSSGA